MSINKQETANDQSEQYPHYRPYGWEHWPDYPWMSYQFRRGLGETQEGMGTISMCFLAAKRMKPGDKESWFAEWSRVADENKDRGDAEARLNHIVTARNCWQRAVGFYRQAEFWLKGNDARRREAFSKMEECSHKFLKSLRPAGEVVQIPYEHGASLTGYFVRSALGAATQPCLISMGGLDSVKDEMWAMQAHGCLQRGMSVLMIDGPGQGSALHRYQLPTRYDYEVPISACVDYLETRAEVDPKRIAVCGSSLGGYYAARAGSFEPRLAATIAHGAIWSISKLWANIDEDYGLADQIKWVFNTKTVAEAKEKAQAFTLDGVLENMKCPFLIVHGGFDILGVEQANTVYQYAKSKNVNVTLKMFSETETGAEHCQHDNPTLGQEILSDWLADIFHIDQSRM